MRRGSPGVKTNMRRQGFQRSMKEGDDEDQSAVALYLQHIRTIVHLYTRMNTLDAATRALAIVAAWQAAGRSAELAWVNLDIMDSTPSSSASFSTSSSPRRRR